MRAAAAGRRRTGPVAGRRLEDHPRVRIIGHGLIARSLAPYADRHPDALAFASGVSDSSTTSPAEFERECALLYEALEQARRDDLRIVYFSGGGAIYGRWDRPAREDEPLEPRSAYGRHQLVCEAVIRSAGVRYLIARLPNVVGPAGSERQLVPALVRQALAGRVTVQAGAARDLVGVDDMAAVISDLLATGRPRDVVNVASGVSVPVGEIVTAINGLLGVSPEIVPVAGGEAQRFATRRLTARLGTKPLAAPGGFQAVLARYVPDLAVAGRS